MKALDVVSWAGPILIILVGLYVNYRIATHGRRVKNSGAPGFVQVQPGASSGEWNAVVTDDGKHPSFRGRKGHVRIENGWLGFHEGRGPEPTWLVPAHQFRGGKNSMLALSEIWLDSPQTGRINLTVSHEHINALVDNDFKDIRERRYADEFLAMLAWHGAQVSR